MKRILMLFLVVSLIISFITISIEGIPVKETSKETKKIKILLDIAGETDLVSSVKIHLFEAFRKIENVDIIYEYKSDLSYVVSLVLVEARAGENKQKTGNIAACVQYIDYFDNSVLKPDIAASIWDRVDNLTRKLIEESHTGLHLFSKKDLKEMSNRVVSKFQELYLEKGE